MTDRQRLVQLGTQAYLRGGKGGLCGPGAKKTFFTTSHDLFFFLEAITWIMTITTQQAF